MHLDLEAVAEGLVRSDDDARTCARAALRRRGAAGAAEGPTPPRDGRYGRLGDAAIWLAGVRGECPPADLRRPLLVIVGDRSETSAEVERIAAANGSGLRVLPLGSMPAEGLEAVAEAVRGGVELADAEADAGTDLLLVAAPAASCTVPAAILVAALSGLDAPSVVGGDGLDDTTWMRTCLAIRNGLRRARSTVEEPLGLLAAAGGTDLAMLAGLLLRAAARRTPVVLDGTAALAAAFLAQRVVPDAADWWLVAHSDAAPAAVEVLRHLDLTPLLDLGLRACPGTAAVLTVPLLHAAVALLADPSE